MATDRLRIYYQNVRGLRTKTLDFYNGILSVDHDLVLITETWLKDSILDSELADNRYSVFRRDRGSHGGGVMALCSKRLCARARADWSSDQLDLECLWITVEGHSLNSDRDLHIGLVYMPPGDLLAKRVDRFSQ